ncbi:MAG: pitrilysin family protein, partial [bacterium]
MHDKNLKKSGNLFFAVALVFLFCACAFADTSDVKLITLDNGLTVITKEIHTAPVVNLSVWYRVGSRNETTGITGISHELEHMAFKGTKKYPDPGITDRMIREIGGSGNAGTNVDYTIYYETVPAGKQNVAIDIEADRMNGMLLRQEDFASEKTVIMEERKMRNEDSPTGLFWEEINAAAFKVHPYGWPIIGWMADIESMNAEKIKNYYKSHYAPNNAIVVVAGDFNTEEVVKYIKKTFGKIPRGEEPPKMTAVEPEQKVEKQVVFHSDKTNLADVVYAYHAPSITGVDSPALEVISAVMSSGRESRLYKDFVETGLAGSADATHDTNQDAYLFYFEVEAQPGIDPAEIQKKLDEEIDRLKNEPVSDYELQKARNRFAASETFSDESITNYGRKLGWYQLTAGDYKYLDKYLELIGKVTAVDVQRVAKKYFVPSNRTVGIMIPEAPKAEGSSAVPGNKISPRADYGRVAPKAPIGKSASAGGGSELPKIDFSSHVKKRIMPNGLTLIVYENPAFPVVHAHGVIRGAGAFGDPDDKRGLAQLVSRAVRRGTKTRTNDEINKALEFVGADMEISCGNETVVFDGLYLKKDFDMGIGILADVLMNPVFPAEGVEVERAVALSDVAALEKNNRQQAWQAFIDVVYAGHPYSNPVAGTADGLKAATLDDLKMFHSAAYRPDRTIMVFAGDATEDEA